MGLSLITMDESADVLARCPTARGGIRRLPNTESGKYNLNREVTH